MFGVLKDLTWQQLGLTAFISTITGAIAILLVDWLVLGINGRQTITEYCRSHPWLAWLMLSALGWGMAGLAVHLMHIVPIDPD